MASELNVGGVKVGDGSANQNWVQVHSTAAQIAGVKLFRGDGDSSDSSNNNFGLLVTDAGCEISKFTAGGANITGRVPLLTINLAGQTLVGSGATTEKVTKLGGGAEGITVGAALPCIALWDTDNADHVTYLGNSGGNAHLGTATASPIYFQPGGVTKVTIESSGVCQFKNGLSFDQTNTSASGAAATSGVMSHYETGTWTPTVAGATSVGTYSYYARYGYYTRIGNQVTLQFTIWNVTADSAGSGSLIITGLPWPTRNQADTSNVGSVGVDTVTNAGSTHLFLRTAHNASHVEIWKSADGAADDKVAVTDVSSGTTDIYGQITYLI